jgi:hypothetical protein
MTLGVVCPIEGTWLIFEEPLPVGLSAASGIAVHRYDYGWNCEACIQSTCKHIELAKGLEGRSEGKYVSKTDGIWYNLEEQKQEHCCYCDLAQWACPRHGEERKDQ